MAGMQLLTIEYADRLMFLVDLCWQSIALDLCNCWDSLLSSTLANFVFPGMMETVLNSISGVDAIPLIVDSRTSCWVSPCREDFGPDQAISEDYWSVLNK